MSAFVLYHLKPNFSFYKYILSFVSYAQIVPFDRLNLNDMKELSNTTHNIFNDLASDISQNSHLFDSNITTIMTGDICSIAPIKEYLSSWNGSHHKAFNNI